MFLVLALVLVLALLVDLPVDCLLRNDGWLVSLEGQEDLVLEGITSGSYYIALYHKNHLPIISSQPHFVQDTAMTYDFTLTATAAMGDQQLKELNGKYVMYSGDFDNNGLINNSDYNLWKANSSQINVYSIVDADGNGIINSLDYNLISINLSKVGILRR